MDWKKHFRSDSPEMFRLYSETYREMGLQGIRSMQPVLNLNHRFSMAHLISHETCKPPRSLTVHLSAIHEKAQETTNTPARLNSSRSPIRIQRSENICLLVIRDLHQKFKYSRTWSNGWLYGVRRLTAHFFQRQKLTRHTIPPAFHPSERSSEQRSSGRHRRWSVT